MTKPTISSTLASAEQLSPPEREGLIHALIGMLSDDDRERLALFYVMPASESVPDDPAPDDAPEEPNGFIDELSRHPDGLTITALAELISMKIETLRKKLKRAQQAGAVERFRAQGEAVDRWKTV